MNSGAVDELDLVTKIIETVAGHVHQSGADTKQENSDTENQRRNAQAEFWLVRIAHVS